MKMVKSLLLGSAAGLVAVTAGQAADLPVKAKPVEYVKICSLYGAGFYYMPGTDLCLKIGGWVRAEITDGANGSLAWGPYNANLNNRATNDLTFRARGYITADARNQTAYGTVRGYIAVGVNTGDVGTAASEGLFSSNRAFIQFAGMTAGLSQSFFDFYSAAIALYRAGYIPNEDTGDGGWQVWAYTAQLGGGFSATISAETRRMNQIVQQTANVAGVGVIIANGGTLGAASTAGLGYGGWKSPDIVGNLRVDQTWGSAQIMGAAHQVNPLYYSPGGATAAAATAAALQFVGHPSDTWGWAAGAGLKLNAPMITQGDFFQGEVNYTRGAIRYVNHGANDNYQNEQGAGQSFGVESDCVFGGLGGASVTNTGCNLTTAWSVNASFEHYWTPQLHQSLAGGYMAVSFNNQANAILCTLAGGGNGNGGVGTLAVATPGCNNNWSFWGIGSRLQWDVTKTFYLGVEVLYDHQNSATTFNGLVAGTGYALGAPGAPVVVANENNWAFTARAHRDFLP